MSSASSPVFEWTSERTIAAIALAEGKTQQEVSEEVGVTDRTLRNWLSEQVFAEEVDRLSLMLNIASRAERLRIAMRAVRAKTKNGIPETERDILDWLKFVQSETDGVKLDLTKLAAAFGTNDTSLAPGGQSRAGAESETDDQIHPF